jgi:hypothetical protein
VRAAIYGSTVIRTISALALGLCKLGWSITWREDRDAFKANQEGLHEFDLIVTEGIRGPMGAMCREASALGIPVLISDAAFVRRDLGFYQLGVNRLNWIPKFWVPGDRWADLGVELQDPSPGSYILISGQKPGDAAHDLSASELVDLYQDWTQELRKYTERPILFRPHPMGKDILPDGLETSSERPLAEDLAGCHALVTWNSTSSADAIITGKPAFVMGPNALAQELANTELANIESPYFPEADVRRDFFHRVAYGQWTREEFENGHALDFTLPTIGWACPPRGLVA